MFNSNASRDELIEAVENAGFTLDDIEGSGSSGYVTVGDIEDFLSSLEGQSEEPSEGPSEGPNEEESELEPTLESVDTALAPEEEEEEEEIDPESISVPDREFELEGAFVVDAGRAEQIATRASARQRNVHDLVVYTGQSENHSLVLNYAIHALTEEGIIYVPEELSDYSVLSRVQETTPEKELSGFVAFARE